MNELLYKYSKEAGYTCPVAFRIQACLLLKSENVGLYKATTESGFEYFAWVDKKTEIFGDSKVLAFTLPLENLGEAMRKTVSYKHISPDEVFVYNGEAYYLHCASFGDNYVIRKLTAFMHEDIAVKVATNGENKQVESVFISKFYLWQDGMSSYRFTAWGIMVEGELFYLPVFADEFRFFAEREPDKYMRKEAEIGSYFRHGSQSYRICTDQREKMCIIPLKGFNVLVKEPGKLVQKAKIINLKKQRG